VRVIGFDEQWKFRTWQLWDYEFAPRGHMFNVHTARIPANRAQYPNLAENWITIDFARNYPTSVVGQHNDNRFPHGYNVRFYDSRTLIGESGIYVYPSSDSVIYINRILFSVEVLNKNDIAKDLCQIGCTLQLVHNGEVYCEAKKLSDLLSLSFGYQIEESVYTVGAWTYMIPIVAIPPGKFSGEHGEYFQIRMSGHTAPVNNYLLHLFVGFEMWEVEG
jgi:hypothetical protein